MRPNAVLPGVDLGIDPARTTHIAIDIGTAALAALTQRRPSMSPQSSRAMS
jgi:hypothetical protein